MSNIDLQFKIGIIGPTRVGKTSLIAAILKDSQRLLAGVPLSIRPRGTATERRIVQHHRELEGSLRAEEFNPGAVKGTQEPFTFELHIDPGKDISGIHLSLLDYPGGWLDTLHRPPERENDWKVCKDWMIESTVLIIPIESAVLMEAMYPKWKKAVPFILTTYEVEQVAREWAKERNQRPNEPALLLFCPVKCESYFSDNGGSRDSSEDLFDAVRHLYHDVLEAVRNETKDSKVKAVYLPVDTIGCVEIINSNWRSDERIPGGFECSASYRVRPPGRQLVKGADDVLVALCKHLVEAKQRAEAATADQKDRDAESAKRFAEKKEGFLRDIWLWVSGERNRRKQDMRERLSEAREQRRIVETLDQTVNRLAERDFGSRARIIL